MIVDRVKDLPRQRVTCLLTYFGVAYVGTTIRTTRDLGK